LSKCWLLFMASLMPCRLGPPDRPHSTSSSMRGAAAAAPFPSHTATPTTWDGTPLQALRWGPSPPGRIGLWHREQGAAAAAAAAAPAAGAPPLARGAAGAAAQAWLLGAAAPLAPGTEVPRPAGEGGAAPHKGPAGAAGEGGPQSARPSAAAAASAAASATAVLAAAAAAAAATTVGDGGRRRMPSTA
jgi:hypothetical protein